MNFSFLGKYSEYYLKGAVITVLLAVLAVVFGTVLGLLLSLLRRSKFKVLSLVARAYVEFVRGTPLLVQIYIIYIGFPKLNGLPKIMEIPMEDLLVGVIALALNSAAYVSEIIRAGIDAVDKGQMEAARSLGMNQKLAMFEVVIPQAFKNILPALGNEFISVIKESSMVSVYRCWGTYVQRKYCKRKYSFRFGTNNCSSSSLLCFNFHFDKMFRLC